MTDRKSRRLFPQRLASVVAVLLVGGLGGVAFGQQTELAYYISDPALAGKEIRMVVADEQQSASFHGVLQATALMLQEPLPMPVQLSPQDLSISSSSDLVGDENFPSGPPPETDVDADFDGTLVPVPLEAPFSEVAAGGLNAPVLTKRRPSLGSTAGSYSAAPNMLGDHFGGTSLFGPIGGHTVALGGGDRRFKIAENVSPAPQDRVFFNYNHFENALRDLNDVNRSLDRFTFGFEKTLLSGNASIELRLPFASGLNSRQTFGAADTQATELGNLGLAFKMNLLSGCDWILSGGTGITIPTGDDFEAYTANALDLRVKNDAVHLSPFVGYLHQPNQNWFFQSFIQADFDLSGNDVFTGTGGFEGVIQDQNLLFLDASLGRWIYRNCNPCKRFSGLAAIAELHYTTTMNDTDTVSAISNPYNRMDILNASGALNFLFRRTSLRVGGAAPLRDDEERLFDAEIIFQLNRRY